MSDDTWRVWAEQGEAEMNIKSRNECGDCKDFINRKLDPVTWITWGTCWKIIDAMTMPDSTREDQKACRDFKARRECGIKEGRE